MQRNRDERHYDADDGACNHRCACHTRLYVELRWRIRIRSLGVLVEAQENDGDAEEADGRGDSRSRYVDEKVQQDAPGVGRRKYHVPVSAGRPFEERECN